MRICILTHTFPKNINDSTAPFMHALSLGFSKIGHEVFVLTPYNSELREEDFPYKVVAYKYIWPKFLHILGYSQTLKYGSKLKLSAYILFPFLFIFGVFTLIRLARKEKFAVISSHWLLPNGFLAFCASRFLKIPYIVSLPGSDVYLAKKNKIFSKIAVISANNAAAVISDSPRFLEIVLSLGANLKKTQIIPYPVEVKKTKPSLGKLNLIRKKLNLERDNLVLLAVGRLVSKKGFDYLIKALPPLFEKYKNLRLIIVGDGDLRQEWEKLVWKLNLDKCVKFVGSVNRDELLNYYNLADIFVMPSIKDKEGNIDDQPVSLIEAMACGKPIIATNFPGIALTVKNGVSGYLFPEKNISSLTKFLEKLILSSKLRIKMGKASKKIVEQKLTDRKIAEKYIDLIYKATNI